MAKPSSITTWATDPGTTADPGPARRATGFVAGKKLPAKWLNWLLSQNGAWLTYLRDLHEEPEFLNKLYKWTGTHRFGGGLGINGEIVYSDLEGAVSAPDRWVHLPITGLVPATYEGVGAANGTPSWKFYRNPADGVVAESYEWRAAAAGFPLVGLYRLPTGSVVTAMRVNLHLDAEGSSITLNAGLYSGVGGPASNPGVSAVVEGPYNDLYEMAIPDSPPITGSSRLFRVSFRWATTNLGALLGAVGSGLAVRFADPGPRNF